MGADTQCVFWDRTLDGKHGIIISCIIIIDLDGFGDWSTEGCTINNTAYNVTGTRSLCHCTHLTSFCVILVLQYYYTHLLFQLLGCLS